MNFRVASLKFVLGIRENLILPSAKFNSHEIKLAQPRNSIPRMKKFRGFWQPREIFFLRKYLTIKYSRLST